MERGNKLQDFDCSTEQRKPSTQIDWPSPWISERPKRSEQEESRDVLDLVRGLAGQFGWVRHERHDQSDGRRDPERGPEDCSSTYFTHPQAPRCLRDQDEGGIASGRRCSQ